jgi:hypothetical protein
VPPSLLSYCLAMRTGGIDLAAESVRTAVAWLDWSAGGARVSAVEVSADDDVIVDAVIAADKAGIGWPDKFVDFVTAHRTGHVGLPGTVTGRAWRRDLRLRVTDQVVHHLTGLTPLSVSADRIGHTAMRCAGLLAELAKRGEPVDRRGQGVVVESIPRRPSKGGGGRTAVTNAPRISRNSDV